MNKTNESNPMVEIKNRFRSELRESFNEDKFDEDVKSGKNISLSDLTEYRKKEKKVKPPKSKNDDKSRMANGHGLSFVGSFKNGEYTAIGSNGHIIKSKNIDDFHRQLAKVFKLNALKKKEEAICELRLGQNITNPKQFSESFARNFINEGITVKGDLPKSPEFWNRMKAEYLSQKGHDLKTWNNLTRFVPTEYMRPINDYTINQTTIQKNENKRIPPMAVKTARIKGSR